MVMMMMGCEMQAELGIMKEPDWLKVVTHKL